MAKDNEPKIVDKELLRDNPDQTIAPPQIKLQQEPIPNPDLEDDQKESQ